MGDAMNPEIRIIRGRPADDEVAALVAVVLALAETAGADPGRPGPDWTSKRLYRPPGAWTTARTTRPVVGGPADG